MRARVRRQWRAGDARQRRLSRRIALPIQRRVLARREPDGVHLDWNAATRCEHEGAGRGVREIIVRAGRMVDRLASASDGSPLEAEQLRSCAWRRGGSRAAPPDVLAGAARGPVQLRLLCKRRVGAGPMVSIGTASSPAASSRQTNPDAGVASSAACHPAKLQEIESVLQCVLTERVSPSYAPR